MYQNTRKNFRFLYLKKKPASYRAPTAAHLGTLSDVTAAEKKLRKIIDELSLQLREMVAERGFADDAVVALSQKLDIYIVQLQHLLRQKSNFCQ
ncbi:MAG: aspartyl-phosphate phosphatase Spo0E family protein [Brevibacillus sp.]|nr:aspartyl-phosphate phosphatase Spo0E family protein [Brevibacillus sp.]